MSISRKIGGSISAAAFFAGASPVLAQASPAAAPPAPVQSANADTHGLQDIIVTAQKTSQRINDVGMSIQALSGDSLTKLGITDTSQLGKAISAFQYTPSPFGTPIFTVRGVGFFDTSLAAGPTVSIYSDEVPLPYAAMAQGASLDLERVEVLKGPQGTLFGVNSTGGAINYIAAKPGRAFDAGFDASYGRFNTVDLQGFVNLPLNDTLQIRIAGRSLQAGAWQKSFTRDDSLGASDFLNGRILVKWAPISNFRALLNVSGWRDHSESPAPQFISVFPASLNNPLPVGFVNYPTAPRNDRAADWNPGVDYRRNNRMFFTSLKLEYDITDDITVTSLSSYEHFKRDQPIEGDGTTFDTLATVQAGFVKTEYQELRVGGPIKGTGNWIVGGNYEHDSILDDLHGTNSDSANGVVFGIPLGQFAAISRQKARTFGFFANVEYPIFDKLSVQGGIRYSNDRRSANSCTIDAGGNGILFTNFLQGLLRSFYGLSGFTAISPGGCTSLGPAPEFIPGPFIGTLENKDVSWRAAINWKPFDHTLIYANVSKGYKSGAFPNLGASVSSQFAPAKQEKLLAYEAGFKSSLFDRTVQLDGAVFYYHYVNKQTLGNVVDPIFGPLSGLKNIPKSHVWGFELSGAWTPMAGLTITPSFSYTDTTTGKFQDFNYLGLPQDFTGEHFIGVPKVQANGDAQYQWDVKDGLQAFVGGNVTYQSALNNNFGDYALFREPPRALLDLRAGVNVGKWQASIWGRNVTNKYYSNFRSRGGDDIVRYTGMPVTYGVTVSFRFR